jgi:hypothetical protein
MKSYRVEGRVVEPVEKRRRVGFCDELANCHW